MSSSQCITLCFLSTRIRLEIAQGEEQVALDPRAFRTLVASPPPGTVAPVAGLLYPALGAATRSRVAAVHDHDARLAANIEHAFASDDWRRCETPARRVEGTLADLSALLQRLPGHAIEGPGDVSREAAACLGLV